jgi:hypothetical protein
MKRLFAGTCLAAVCAVGLSAQTQPPAAQSQPTTKDDKMATVTGCLRAGDQAGSFVLANAKWDKGGAASSATGTTGSAAAGAAGAADKTIRLSGSPAGTQLSEHVGHTVQVTGKIDAASATAPAPSGTSGAAGSRPSGPALQVESLKMVSSSCDGGR